MGGDEMIRITAGVWLHKPVCEVQEAFLRATGTSGNDEGPGASEKGCWHFLKGAVLGAAPSDSK